MAFGPPRGRGGGARGGRGGGDRGGRGGGRGGPRGETWFLCCVCLVFPSADRLSSRQEEVVAAAEEASGVLHVVVAELHEAEEASLQVQRAVPKSLW